LFPGRAKLAISPTLTGSMSPVMTIGDVLGGAR